MTRTDKNPIPDDVRPPSRLLFVDDEPAVLKALKEIKRMDPAPFVCMLSGNSSFDNVKEAMSAGADGFLVNPYSRRKVQEILEKFAGAVSGNPDSLADSAGGNLKGSRRFW